jgi:hypothetical protein
MRIHVTTAETGVPWDLSLEQFAQRMAAYRPDALTVLDPDDRNPQVRFEISLGDEDVSGIYFTGASQQLACWDATIDGWAPVIAWFLSLLPLEADADIFLEAVAVPQPLPRPTTAPDIARILTELDNSI